MPDERLGPCPCLALWTHRESLGSMRKLLDGALAATDIQVLDAEGPLESFLDYLNVPASSYVRILQDSFRVMENASPGIWAKHLVEEMIRRWGRNEGGKFCSIGWDNSQDCEAFAYLARCPMAFINPSEETEESLTKKLLSTFEQYYG